MINAKIIHLRVATEQVAFLLVDHKLLDEFVVLQHVQVQASGWLSGPWLEGKYSDKILIKIQIQPSPTRHFVAVRHGIQVDLFTTETLVLIQKLHFTIKRR